MDAAILSVTDYERIRKNAVVLTKEEEKNQKKIFEEQKENKHAEARVNIYIKIQARRERLKEIDKNRTDKYQLSDIDKENLERNKVLVTQAKKLIEEDHDTVKEMNKMTLYAKVATIRDRQKEEQKYIHKEYKKQQMKMDLMMELERLKELRFQEERERQRKELQRQGSTVIIDQIKERELERLRQKEILERERQLMMKQISELEQEDIKIADAKKEQSAKLSKEVIEANKEAIEAKERKKIEEREFELKVLQYNLEKARREEEELAEKKRLQDEKEKEVQKLREKQERFKDKQAELDAIRAKRAYEDYERGAREKEKNEIIQRNNKVLLMLEANEKQKFDKELKLAEQAKQEESEYYKIVENQLKNLDFERKREEDRKTMRYDHNFELR